MSRAIPCRQNTKADHPLQKLRGAGNRPPRNFPGGKHFVGSATFVGEPLLQQRKGAVFQVLLVSESVKPRRAEVSAEPRHLALGVTARVFRGVLDCFVKSGHTLDMGESLSISE